MNKIIMRKTRTPSGTRSSELLIIAINNDNEFGNGWTYHIAEKKQWFHGKRIIEGDPIKVRDWQQILPRQLKEFGLNCFWFAGPHKEAIWLFGKYGFKLTRHNFNY